MPEPKGHGVVQCKSYGYPLDLSLDHSSINMEAAEPKKGDEY